MLSLVAFGWLAAVCCHADGGGVIARQTVNGLRVTVLASPMPLRAGPVDVSVLVQDGEKTVLDAAVEVAWRSALNSPPDWLPPCCTIGFWHGEDSGCPGALEQQVSLLGNCSGKVRRAVRTRHRRIERRSGSVGPVPRRGSPCSAAGSCILAVASVSARCNRRIRPAPESREIQAGRRQDRSFGKRRVIGAEAVCISAIAVGS